MVTLMLYMHAHNNTDPGEVQNIVCAVSSSPSELSFSWNLPTMLGDEVVSYQVMVNRLEHRPGTRDVIQSDVVNKFVEEPHTSATGLGMNAWPQFLGESAS